MHCWRVDKYFLFIFLTRSLSDCGSSFSPVISDASSVHLPLHSEDPRRSSVRLVDKRHPPYLGPSLEHVNLMLEVSSLLFPACMISEHLHEEATDVSVDQQTKNGVLRVAPATSDPTIHHLHFHPACALLIN
ncbi:hypothetical protein BKA64DRAFT_175014 [Cadophora sp. MPI-SDFR-AT-0126]|nr:hypothetical protein BKA64DRAFT_175014 [Leotiomycetes sp. MPI-SDFR-AT-0126]